MNRIDQGKAIRVEIANGITARLQLLPDKPGKRGLAPTLSPSDGNTRFAPRRLLIKGNIERSRHIIAVSECASRWPQPPQGKPFVVWESFLHRSQNRYIRARSTAPRAIMKPRIIRNTSHLLNRATENLRHPEKILGAAVASDFSTKKPTRRSGAPPGCIKKRFYTGVSAWRIGRRSALSNFVLIPIKTSTFNQTTP